MGFRNDSGKLDIFKYSLFTVVVFYLNAMKTKSCLNFYFLQTFKRQNT